METTLENARPGDRVWSMRHGWGVVEVVNDTDYPITVKFDFCYKTFTFQGLEYEEDLIQVLFWDEVKIVAPPRPKRKVKTVVAWANIYDANEVIYDTKFNADSKAGQDRIACVKLVGEYEVKEC